MTLVRCELGAPVHPAGASPCRIEGSAIHAGGRLRHLRRRPGDGPQTSSPAARASHVEDEQIRIARETCMTDRPGVFAGGDAAATGYFTAVEAIAAGRRAAAAIHNHLRGETPAAGLARRTGRRAPPRRRRLAAVALGPRVPMELTRRPRAPRRLARSRRKASRPSRP